MNTILVAGNFHTILQNHIQDVVNANALVCSEVISFLNEGIISPDLFIYTDEGMSKDGHVFVENIKRTVEFTEQNNLSSKIVIMTGNSEILKLALPPQVDVKFFFGKRVPFEEYRAIQKKYYVQKQVSESKGKNDGWLNKLFSSNDSPEQQTISSGLSQGISRVVAVTGHRGSGVTSTAVNLAESAVKEGLSVIVVDLDVKLRGINMYFSGFSNSDNENLSSSLIRLLAKPQSFETCTYKAKPGLYVSTLPYSFAEKQLEDKFINAEKIITMISVLKNQFNLCIIDLPIDTASEYSSILAHVDAFGLCVKNSLYSVLNTARSMDFWLNNEYRKMVAAKSKIIITEYNDKIIYHGENFTPNKTVELLKAVSTDFMMAGAPVGYVPYTEEFSGQIETEVSLVDSNAKMKEAYKKILIRILEGVG